MRSLNHSKLEVWSQAGLVGQGALMTHPFTPSSGFTLGTPIFAHYTSARRWYAPRDLAKVNNSEIERVTEMEKKEKKEK